MGTWLNRLRDSISETPRASTSVRYALQNAQRARTRIELTPLSGLTTGNHSLTTIVEDVRDDVFVIGIPVVAGAARPLAHFGLFQLSFVGPGGQLIGQTRNLGRTRLKTSTGQMIPGYRLEIPDVLLVEERRSELRAVLGNDFNREASLRVLDHTGVIFGLVQDISATGVQLTCRNAPKGLKEGAHGLFMIDLPEPIGEVNEMVNIIAVEPDPESGAITVRLRFRQRNEVIADALGKNRKTG